MLHKDTVKALADELGQPTAKILRLTGIMIHTRGFYKVVHTDHGDPAHMQLTPDAAEHIRIAVKARALRKAGL